MIELNFMDLLFTLLNFFILLALLYVILYRPVLQLLSEREERIKAEDSKIEDLRKESEELKVQWEEKNRELACDVRRILEEAKQEGLKEKEEIIREAKAEARQILARASREARRERGRAWEELWGEMVGIIITIATKVVGEEFDDEKHRNKIRSFIKDLDSKMIGELTNEAH